MLSSTRKVDRSTGGGEGLGPCSGGDLNQSGQGREPELAVCVFVEVACLLSGESLPTGEALEDLREPPAPRGSAAL
ncbi:MAG: hypothetical protein IPK72_24075 [Candidatus Eisenbacteria bacterium]|nr:hypothetical protein [Candidatus Eisenbacteria bacterium]